MATVDPKDGRKLWEDCLQYMALRIKKHSFNTWFKHAKGDMNGDGELRIIVPNQFVADWLRDKYSDLILEAINEVSGKGISYEFQVNSSDDATYQTEMEFFSPPAVTVKIPDVDNPSDGRYRFDNFVVGKFNQFAHAAAAAVAEAPGKTKYNPLLIYGGTGLGKTHLLQAIGHFVHQELPRKRAIYATSEKFTSDFINSISNGTTSNFTTLYRTTDVLLIDDVQFFSGKESTQEQFFHTFNDLYQSGKQIVLTSDRHPRDIRGLEERLLSRFSSGLVVDLQPPDLETRIAILGMLMKREGVTISEDVLFFVADNVTSNIRELEGALTKLMAHASLEKADITVDFAINALGKELIRPRRQVSVSHIQKKTADFFQIDPAMMTAKKKTAQIALARQVAMYLTRRLTDLSLKSIGELFGGRDHSTVIHACDLVERMANSNADFKERIKNIQAAIIR
jgi:chromosomal replication initiator protein